MTTAPNPLYRPSGVSFFTISFPTVKKPFGFNPGILPLRLSCIRTLMVSVVMSEMMTTK